MLHQESLNSVQKIVGTRAFRNISLSGNLANREKIFCSVNDIMQNTFFSPDHNWLF